MAGNQGSSGAGRGQVKHPQTQAPLKGSEQSRPQDKERGAQAEGGRKGGQSSGAGSGKR